MQVADSGVWAKLLLKLRSFEAYAFLLDLVVALHDKVAFDLVLDPPLVAALGAVLSDVLAAAEGPAAYEGSPLDLPRWLTVPQRRVQE